MRRGSGCLLYEKTYMPAEGWQVWFHVKKWRIALRMKEMTLNINSLYMYMYCFTKICIHTHAHTCKQTRSMGYTHTHTHSHTPTHAVIFWMLGWRTVRLPREEKRERKNERPRDERAAALKTLHIHMLIPYTHNSADCIFIYIFLIWHMNYVVSVFFCLAPLLLSSIR